MDESAEWLVKGARGVFLGRTDNLRRALDAVVEISAWQHVVSLERVSSDKVVVFSAQLDRLLKAHSAGAPSLTRSGGRSRATRATSPAQQSRPDLLVRSPRTSS
jgi:hypothetical protein